MRSSVLTKNNSSTSTLEFLKTKNVSLLRTSPNDVTVCEVYINKHVHNDKLV